jgi:hypothetical protein
VDSESQVGEVLLKDKFLTQSAPDICRKPQKPMAEGEKLLDQLMQPATSAFYNWDLTKKRPNCSSLGVRHRRAFILSVLPLQTGGALPQEMLQRGTAWETALTPTGTLPPLQN